MDNRKNLAGETGFFNLYTLAVALVAICAVGAAVMLAPAQATSDRPASSAYAGPNGYLPDQVVNQAENVEPMPEIYY
jgi:hypothetical protein